MTGQKNLRRRQIAGRDALAAALKRGATMRIGIRFSRTGRTRFVSHLDMQRLFARALRRTGIPVKFSQGFNPHIVTSFASALPVGMETYGDYMEFYIEGEEKITYIIQRLNEVLPEGIKVLDAGKIEEKAPKLMAASKAAQVEIICEENEKKDALISGIEQILKSESCICEKKSKGKIRNFDIRPLIFDCKIEGGHIILELAHSGAGSLSPYILIEEAKRRADFEADVRAVRLDLLVQNKNKLASMSEMFIR